MKKEVKDVFLLRRIIWMLQAEIIDREDIRQSMQVIMNMTRRVKEGDNFILFAEGTRSRNGNNLLEFKGGSFKSAMNAKCPIVPVALIDSFKAFDTGSIKKITVQIHYLKPLYYEDYKGMKSTEIAELVASMIQDTIHKYEHKNA
jgi:1-acyl-sn-glycerol-3-phosphate acyltransferase